MTRGWSAHARSPGSSECEAGMPSRVGIKRTSRDEARIGDKGGGREQSAADNMKRSKVQTRIFRSVRWEIGGGAPSIRCGEFVARERSNEQ